MCLSQHYMDGAISNNLPHCHERNTLTFSAYAGKSDICPRDGTRYFHAFSFNNVSIQVNSENMYRVTSTFFPPEPQVRPLGIGVLSFLCVCVSSL